MSRILCSQVYKPHLLQKIVQRSTATPLNNEMNKYSLACLACLAVLLVVTPALIKAYSFDATTIDPNNPEYCFSESGVTDMFTLFDCLDAFTVQKNDWDVSLSFTDLSRYDAAQPTAQERADFTATVTAMLNIDGDCSCVTVPTSISSYYAIATFTDTSKNSDFCVFYEKVRKRPQAARSSGYPPNHVVGIVHNYADIIFIYLFADPRFAPQSSRQAFTSTRKEYEKGWGVFVVPKTARQVSRFIHLSAPHPKWDLGTPQQAAYLFANSGAKSLLVDGRHRWAISTQSACISAGNHSLTDPTHDNNEVFHSASQAIHNWQINAPNTCPVTGGCAFIQIHGKGNDCDGSGGTVNSRIFVSNGLAGSSTLYQTYSTSPANRLAYYLSLEFGAGSGGVNMPINDTVCDLAAFTNVFGRIVNGVSNEPANNECIMAATDASAFNMNRFVHAEQSPDMRALSPDSCPSTGCSGASRSINTNWPAWNTALKKAFDATCVGGVPADSDSLLCPP
ncbi:hypothetical protein BC936DRAFT_149040 [Jimgerdemannia flammicorona]|uniref:Uncharacterized protein n=1 Tax=Jimgerdemannia flammicorona TaxID=994334 RepID=A0A433D1Q3_9FUNG|nr:hypothetical protein BC936DRAFT_149040 [Jimgerdemannia flammicorona]